MEAAGTTITASGFGAAASDSRRGVGRIVARRQSYFLQYISLMLIIATLVVGAFLRGPTTVAGPAIAPELRQIKASEPRLIADLEYQDLFQGDDATLNLDKAEALRQVLQSHDIAVRLTVFAPIKSGLSIVDPTGLVLARSTALFRFLISAGVPAAAVRAEGSLKPSELQTHIQLFREVLAHE